MFSPSLMERIGKAQQLDRLNEAQLDRLLDEARHGTSLKIKLSVVLSGIGLAVLLAAQLV